MKYKRTICLVSGAACLLLAAGLILYPILGNALAEKNKSLVMTEYSRAVEKMTDTRVAEMLAAAEVYNAALSPISVSGDGTYSLSGLTAAQEQYDEILAVNESGIMGQLEIPELDIRLPIYHGTDGSTLEKGVGHLLGSSFPVGGKGTHTVLTGHSGLSREKMLTDLEKMKVGDRFFLHVLDRTLAYEVQDIFTVLPDDTSHLSIQQDEDMCTLITCTPYGVNTHRLLVQGSRIPYVPAEETEASAETHEENTDSHWEKQYWLGVRLGLAAMAAVVLLLSVYLFVRKEKTVKKKGGRYVRK
mgnify:CR=1 FL=1